VTATIRQAQPQIPMILQLSFDLNKW